MDRERELKIIRRAYAKQVAAAAGVEDPRIEAAFAAVGIRLAERPSVTLRRDMTMSSKLDALINGRGAGVALPRSRLQSCCGLIILRSMSSFGTRQGRS